MLEKIVLNHCIDVMLDPFLIPEGNAPASGVFYARLHVLGDAPEEIEAGLVDPFVGHKFIHDPAPCFARKCWKSHPYRNRSGWR